MSAEELKPCPFCGSIEVSLSTSHNMTGEVAAKFGECHNCAAMGPETEPSDLSDENATSLWNNRRSEIVETAQQPNNSAMPGEAPQILRCGKPSFRCYDNHHGKCNDTNPCEYQRKTSA